MSAGERTRRSAKAVRGGRDRDHRFARRLYSRCSIRHARAPFEAHVKKRARALRRSICFDAHKTAKKDAKKAAGSQVFCSLAAVAAARLRQRKASVVIFCRFLFCFSCATPRLQSVAAFAVRRRLPTKSTVFISVWRSTSCCTRKNIILFTNILYTRSKAKP